MFTYQRFTTRELENVVRDWLKSVGLSPAGFAWTVGDPMSCLGINLTVQLAKNPEEAKKFLGDTEELGIYVAEKLCSDPEEKGQ